MAETTHDPREDCAPVAVGALMTAQQFVLGACRCWDAFIEHPDPWLAWRELTPVFTSMNVLGALCAFERLFAVLHRHPLRTLQFGEVDCTAVGPDEARMLSSLASLQRGHALAAIDTLNKSLTRYGVRSVLPPLARIAAVLDARGLRLPLWRDTLRRKREPAPTDEISSPPRCPAQ
jgi:hypothetical protein